MYTQRWRSILLLRIKYLYRLKCLSLWGHGDTSKIRTVNVECLKIQHSYYFATNHKPYMLLHLPLKRLWWSETWIKAPWGLEPQDTFGSAPACSPSRLGASGSGLGQNGKWFILLKRSISHMLQKVEIPSTTLHRGHFYILKQHKRNWFVQENITSFSKHSAWVSNTGPQDGGAEVLASGTPLDPRDSRPSGVCLCLRLSHLICVAALQVPYCTSNTGH